QARIEYEDAALGIPEQSGLALQVADRERGVDGVLGRTSGAIDRAAPRNDRNRLAALPPDDRIQAPPADDLAHRARAAQKAFVGAERQLVNRVGFEDLRDVIADALFFNRDGRTQIHQAGEVTLAPVEIGEGLAVGVIGLEVEAAAEAAAYLGLQRVIIRVRTVAHIIRDEGVRIRAQEEPGAERRADCAGREKEAAESHVKRRQLADLARADQIGDARVVEQTAEAEFGENL